MSRFENIFSNPHVILPVIHVESVDQALRNTERAITNGCDGVFLINHEGTPSELLDIYKDVREQYPDIWIGVNLLGVAPWDAFGMLEEGINGLWVDNAHIKENDPNQIFADQIKNAQIESKWEGLYFGGVAFKYQRDVTDLRAAAHEAEPYMDVITTSGKATGRAAEVWKIKQMTEVLEKPLAIASGVTPSNVSEYLPFAKCFLVATGISESWSEFEPILIKQLVQKVREYRNDGSPGSILNP